MRRNDRAIQDPERMETILKTCLCCRIGLNDGNEVYIVPVSYGFEKQDNRYVLYFHGAKAGRKYTLAQSAPFVGFEMDNGYQVLPGKTACQYSARYQSLIGQGTLRLVEDETEKRHALTCIMAHQTDQMDWNFPSTMLAATAVFRLDVTKLSGKEHQMELDHFSATNCTEETLRAPNEKGENTMEQRNLTLDQCRDIYDTYLCHDFPADEVKPFSVIRDAFDRGAYSAKGFYENGQLQGYAFFHREKNWILLDYFAVCSGIRGQGIGSRIFALIRESLQPGETLFIEAEKPNEEDPATLTIRQRRIAFYRRNGATMSGVLGWAFGVCYRLLYCGNHISDDDVEQGMKAVYASLLSPASFQANIRFHRD